MGKRKNVGPIKVRSDVARAAWNATGAGPHNDRRTGRTRARSAQRQSAISDSRG